jgi:hypothetical protein
MPESMTVEATIAPDMPLWYGQAGAVYWRRPTGELLDAVRVDWTRVWNVVAAGRFPGEQYAQALFVLGALVAAWRGWRGFVVLAVWFAACAMPYLLVGSPADFRRGVATVVPFAAGIGLGVLWLAAWLPRAVGVPSRWRDGVAVGLAVLTLACVRWPHEASGLIGSGNAWCQNDPPVHTLAHHPLTRGRRAIFVRRAPQPTCVDALLPTAEVQRALRGPLVRLVDSAAALDEAADALGRDEYLALDCRSDAHITNAELCDAAFRRHALILSDTAWPAWNTAWVVIPAPQ